MTAPRFEVCVISYGSGKQLVDCVRSLRLVPGARLRLREHGASPESIDLARAAADEIGLDVAAAHHPENPGFAAGMNALAEGATAPWLFFLNPDAEVLSFPWVEGAPPAGEVIGAVQVDVGGQPIRAYGRRFGVIDEVLRSWGRRFPEPRDGFGFVGGAGLMIERQAFADLGGFDERYFLFYEDIDLCFRAIDAGRRVVLDPALRVRHDTGSSTRRQWHPALAQSYRSARIFHGSRGHSLRGYDLFVAVDGAARAAAWRVRGDRERSRAHWAIARCASGWLVARRNRADEEPTGWPA
jgi:GT2 family glycosyltransferase